MEEERTDGPGDSELIACLANGDLGALEVLCLRHAAAMFSLLFRMFPTLSTDELEDLRQDVFLSLVDAARNYQDQGRFRSWLYGVAIRHGRNRSRRFVRRRRLLKSNQAAFERTNAGGSPFDLAFARITVCRALTRLPKAQREVLILHVLEGMNDEEISGVLGIRPKTVWTRLHRARRTLRAYIGG